MQELPPILTPPTSRPPRRRRTARVRRPAQWGRRIAWSAVILMACVAAWPMAAMRWGDDHPLTRVFRVPAHLALLSLAWLAEHLGAELRVVAWWAALGLPLFLVVFLAVGAAIKVFGPKQGP